MTSPEERARAYRRFAEGEELLVLGAPLSAPVPRPAGVAVVVLDEHAPVALLRENLEVNERGFDPAAAAVTDRQAEEFRPQLRGARTVTVRVAGEPVAAGMVLPVRDGVAELAGITTLVTHRRRGYGRLVTEALIETAVGLGADLIVLTTDDPGARRLYRAVGFATPTGPAS